MLSLQRHQSDVNYFQHSLTQRMFSASVALMVCTLFISQLNQDFLRKIVPTNTSMPTTMMFTLIRPVAATLEKKPLISANATALNQEPNTRSITKQSKQNQQTAPQSTQTEAMVGDPQIKQEQKTERELITIFPEQNGNSSSIASPINQVNKSNIAKYGFDSAGVRGAYEASKSDIQKMAEKNGTTLENSKPSKHDQFQQAANRAAKPDCLRQGASILSLFVVAYQAATDHCK